MIVRKHLKKWQVVYGVYKKDSARYPNRFYEVHVRYNRPFIAEIIASQITVFLLDLKTGKILYQYGMSIPIKNNPGPPYTRIFDEYQQYVKMREAEEEKSGLLDWLWRK
jgi:hypothetical protein